MTDLEHEEWLRDRAIQKDPPKKHVIVGGLQADMPGDENSTARADAPVADEDDDDDDDESEGNGSTTEDTPDQE